MTNKVSKNKFTKAVLSPENKIAIKIPMNNNIINKFLFLIFSIVKNINKKKILLER